MRATCSAKLILLDLTTLLRKALCELTDTFSIDFHWFYSYRAYASFTEHHAMKAY